MEVDESGIRAALMISGFGIAICVSLALMSYTAIGAVFARRIFQPTQYFLAPALGWALHTAAALPIFFVLDFSRWNVAAALIVPATVAASIEARQAGFGFTRKNSLPVPLVLAIAAAAVLAGSVMAGTLPKTSADGVSLSGPIFDHSKIAMIDEMVRGGVPPANPFYGGEGQPVRLTYYYLWHFGAAELALVSGASGWEADAALTWFTAFASLLTMIGLSVWLSGRASAGLWVVLLAATASLRPILDWIGWSSASEFTGYASGFGGWLFQTSWAPQHTASAMCAILALFVIVRMAEARSIAAFATLVLTMVASFQSSTWIGAAVLPLAAAGAASLVLVRARPARRWPIFISLVAAAACATLILAPFLYDQIAASVLRGDGTPVAIEPYKVLGDTFNNSARPIANLFAYWLLFLPVELPAFYFAGLAGLIFLLKRKTADARSTHIQAFGIAVAASLLVSWLLSSTIGENNDLGWRAALPAILLLIVFAAAGLSLWVEKSKPGAAVPFAALVILSLPHALSIARSNIVAPANASSAGFSASVSLWNAVRKHIGRNDRVANNPLFLEKATPWPVNISWALLSNRRSCYAGPDLVRPFSALSREKREETEAFFARLFSGNASGDDETQLAAKYNCEAVVIVPQDGAWTRSAFLTGKYRLAEAAPGWRIYTRRP